MKTTVRIFLSYAREDEEKVKNLYQKLSGAGFNPWMDKKDILPGEIWQSCIQKAIKCSDFFLACLSANSVNKRGFLQKEIKDALDIWQEMLEDDIYLIPVRLEDCEVLESLCDFQWVNLFEEDGWTRLVKAIRVGMKRREEPIPGKEIATPEEGPEIESFAELQSQYDEFMATSLTQDSYIEHGKSLLTRIRSTGRYTVDPVTREQYAQMARDIGERLFEVTGDYLPVRLETSQVVRSNPFIYGRPVRPDEFVGRESELRTIFNRLRNCESTAVVGDPHVGKTSLLLKLADEKTQQAYLGDDARCLLVVLLDLHYAGNDYTPAVFWTEVLYLLQEHPGHLSTSTAHWLERAAQAGYASRPLERFFNHLDSEGQQLVLLLDEFERLLIHPNFQDPTFFALLRSLATRTGGLALVTAGRLSVAEMNERGRVLLDAGSPFFNNMIEIRLYPFDERTVSRLLNRASDAFSPDDRHFIRRVAGRHPFLLQAMAATLLEIGGDDHQALAAERFYERITFHFDDLWDELDDRTRTTAVILSLLELGGRALGQDFAYGEIERVDAFGPELRKLAERGLAERIGKGRQFDWEHLLLWRGERWTVGTQAFAWWVRDVVVAESRRVPAHDEWLANKRYRFLLTQGQWDRLVNTVRDAPEWAMRGVGALARTLFEELVRRKGS